MHRLILGLASRSAWGDHVDGDRLNNRRENLRPVTPQQSAQNKRPRPGSSKYRGVRWHSPGRGRWRATVTIGGRIAWQASFKDEDEAGRAVAAARSRLMPFSTEAAA